MGNGKIIRGTLSALLILLCVTSFGCRYDLVKVNTGAMLPTIPIDSYVAWESSAYATEEIKRFDIVVHTLPLDEKRKLLGVREDTRYAFRVVGLSGERIQIKNGQLFVNDQKIEEPFEKIVSDDSFGPVLVPQGEYFLLGDNRPESNDSRFWKPPTVGKERIVGKVVKIF